MKEDENIDHIFFKGLEGKSIEKPASYWKDISLNILKNISKPWWGSLNAVIIGIIAVTAIAIIVWYNTNTPSITPIEPKQVESLTRDTVAIEKYTPEESMQATDAVNPDTKQDVIQNQAIKPVEKKTALEVGKQQNTRHPGDSQSFPGSKDSVVVTLPDSVRLNTVDSLNTLKSKQPVPKELNGKKVPTVIIIQDTVIVTDTVKIEKKK